MKFKYIALGILLLAQAACNEVTTQKVPAENRQAEQPAQGAPPECYTSIYKTDSVEMQATFTPAPNGDYNVTLRVIKPDTGTVSFVRSKPHVFTMAGSAQEEVIRVREMVFKIGAMTGNAQSDLEETITIKTTDQELEEVISVVLEGLNQKAGKDNGDVDPFLPKKPKALLIRHRH